MIESWTGFHDGKCDLCGNVDNRPGIDHDHTCCTSGRCCISCIRGILCQKCNGALGLFGDNPDLLLGKTTTLVRSTTTH